MTGSFCCGAKGGTYPRGQRADVRGEGRRGFDRGRKDLRSLQRRTCETVRGADGRVRKGRCASARYAARLLVFDRIEEGSFPLTCAVALAHLYVGCEPECGRN